MPHPPLQYRLETNLTDTAGMLREMYRSHFARMYSIAPLSIHSAHRQECEYCRTNNMVNVTNCVNCGAGIRKPKEKPTNEPPILMA